MPPKKPLSSKKPPPKKPPPMASNPLESPSENDPDPALVPRIMAKPWLARDSDHSSDGSNSASREPSATSGDSNEEEDEDEEGEDDDDDDDDDDDEGDDEGDEEDEEGEEDEEEESEEDEEEAAPPQTPAPPPKPGAKKAKPPTKPRSVSLEGKTKTSKEPKIVKLVHEICDATQCVSTPERAKASPFGALTEENFGIRVDRDQAENHRDLLQERLKCARQRMTKLRTDVAVARREVRKLRRAIAAPPSPQPSPPKHTKKRRNGSRKKPRDGPGRPCKRGRQPRMIVNLSRVPPHEWGRPMLMLVRFLNQALASPTRAPALDIRNVTELQRRLGVGQDTWRLVTETKDVRQLFTPRPRKRTRAQDDSEVKRQLLTAIVPKLQYATTNEIQRAAKDAEKPMSKPTIRRLLRKSHSLRSPSAAPGVTEKDHPVRKEFAARYMPTFDKEGKRIENPAWSRLVFSDECRFTDNVGMHRVWCAPGQSPERKRVSRPQGLMMWLSIGDFGNGHYISHFVWYKKNTTQDSEAYIATLEKAFVPWAKKTAAATPPRKLLLMHDGAPPYGSNLTNTWIATQADVFDVLQGWPARSPDLNPIENMWSWLKQKLKDLPPGQRSMPIIKKKLNELLKSPEANVYAKKVLDSFPKRCAQCYERNGGPTKY